MKKKRRKKKKKKIKKRAIKQKKNLKKTQMKIYLLWESRIKKKKIFLTGIQNVSPNQK
jgi:hypothetical protein